MAGGSTIRLSRLNRHDSTTIATVVPTTVVTLDAIEVAELVTTDCIPLMSLVNRDWTSPPRGRGKNSIGMRCKWAKTSVRSLCVIVWPTSVAIQVWITPKNEDTTEQP